jgi:tetratricopeptide (TPR) repeat protein
MIVKNESQRIADALSSFRAFADEIVVVDTGSTDNTKAVVERFTPHLFDFPWCDDFSAARNFSLQQARGRYIVWLDADDRLEREMQQKLMGLKAHLDGEKAFYFILRDTRASGAANICYQLRCFPRMPGIRFNGRVHEQVYPSVLAAGLKTVTTDIVISHYGYHDEALLLRKTQRNLSLLERERAEGRDDEHIHYYLATTYRLLGREAEALEAMGRALSHLEKQLFHLPPGITRPDFRPTLEALLFLAPLYLKQGNPRQALRSVTKADAIGAMDGLSHFRIGRLYQELNQHAQAIHHLKSSLEAEPAVGYHPSSPPPAASEILLFSAYSLLCLDQWPQALDVLRAVSQSGIPIHEGWEWLGFHALRSGHFQLSLRAFEEGSAAGELSPDSFCNMGMLYNKQGFSQKALSCYHAALAKEPNHKDAKANAAHLLLSLGCLQDAKDLFQQLAGEGVRDIDILLALTVIAVREKDRGMVQTTTRMLRANLSLQSSQEGEPGLRQFYTGIARRCAAQGKPRLAEWAKEIARCVSDAVFCCAPR